MIRSNIISKSTFNKAKVGREYIEKKYKLKKEERDMKKDEWDEIYRRMTILQLSEIEKARVKSEIIHKESLQIRQK